MGKDLPHSKTIRGTLGNPKTQEAIKNNEKPRSMLGDPGSLKAEKTDSNPVPGKQNDDGGNVDFATSSSSSSSVSSTSNSSTSKTIGSPNAADSASGNFDASKEENKNFDPRKYREEVKDAESQGKSVAGKKIEGIEWSDQQVNKGGKKAGEPSATDRVTIGDGPTAHAMQQGKRPPVDGDPKSLEPGQSKQPGMPKSKL